MINNIKRTTAIMLAACFISTAMCAIAVEAHTDIAYTEKEVSVFREELTDETAELRFYEDQPNVPYMGICAYFTMMVPDEKMTVEKQEEGIYYLANITGSAAIDVNADTLTSDDIMDFTNQMMQVQEGMPNVYLDGAPYLRFLEASYDPEKTEVTYDFADYSIDLRGDEEDVYFPLATLSNMFADLAYHYSSYNGVNIYINSDNLMPAADKRDEHYYDSIAVSKRPADAAEFSYHELCFAIDHFYGCPGLGYLDRKADLQNVGLDQALESLGKVGTYTRQLLCSTDMADYITGLYRVGMLIGEDGGHTNIAPKVEFEELNPALSEELEARSDESQKGMTYYGDMMGLEDFEQDPGPGEDVEAMEEFREKLYGKDNTYYTVGDTAVCVLNSFGWIDYEGWEAYYAGGELPKQDTFAIVYDAMNQAQADPGIRHFVLDLTGNGGGSCDTLMGIMSLWMNKSEMTTESILEGQMQTYKYEVDRDLNGTIDAADADVHYDLDYAVLTGRDSFSCANYCAEFMKENGIPIFGHRTAGGSCSILKFASPEGFLYSMSSAQQRLVDPDGNVVEGVDPDFVLSPIEEGGTVDYTEMYDFEKIGDMMEEWYEDE